MVALRDLDPLYNANQILSQANAFFGQNWNPNREIDFNQMIDNQNQYDARQRQADAQEYASQELGDANTPKDVDRIKAKYAELLGDPSMFEKVQKEQEQRDQEKKLADLYSQGSDVDQMRNELEKIKLAAGDVEGAMKLRPRNESKYFSFRGGIQRVNPETGEIEQLTPPMPPQGGQGRAPKLARFMDREGNLLTPDLNNPEELKNIPVDAINLNKTGDPIIDAEIRKVQKAKAERDAQREQQSRAPQAPTPTPDPVSSVGSIKQAYEQLMGQSSGPRYEERTLRNGQRVRVLLGR